MAARNYFRAHGRRRVDLGATLIVRSTDARQRSRSFSQDVRIVNLGLGGACVELADGEPGDGDGDFERARRAFRSERRGEPGSRAGALASAPERSRRMAAAAVTTEETPQTMGNRPRVVAAGTSRRATDGWRASAAAEGWQVHDAQRALLPMDGPDLAPEMEVTVEVTAPTLWDPLVLRGKVAWVRRSPGRRTQAGIRFEHREGPALYALFQLLGAHAFDM